MPRTAFPSFFRAPWVTNPWVDQAFEHQRRIDPFGHRVHTALAALACLCLAGPTSVAELGAIPLVAAFTIRMHRHWRTWPRLFLQPPHAHRPRLDPPRTGQPPLDQRLPPRLGYRVRRRPIRRPPAGPLARRRPARPPPRRPRRRLCPRPALPTQPRPRHGPRLAHPHLEPTPGARQRLVGPGRRRLTPHRRPRPPPPRRTLGQGPLAHPRHRRRRHHPPGHPRHRHPRRLARRCGPDRPRPPRRPPPHQAPPPDAPRRGPAPCHPRSRRGPRLAHHRRPARIPLPRRTRRDRRRHRAQTVPVRHRRPHAHGLVGLRGPRRAPPLRRRPRRLRGLDARPMSRSRGSTPPPATTTPTPTTPCSKPAQPSARPACCSPSPSSPSPSPAPPAASPATAPPATPMAPSSPSSACSSSARSTACRSTRKPANCSWCCCSSPCKKTHPRGSPTESDQEAEAEAPRSFGSDRATPTGRIRSFEDSASASTTHSPTHPFTIRPAPP